MSSITAARTGDALLLIFARYPRAGEVKTRLMPRLGPAGAAAVHARLVARTLAWAQLLAGEAQCAVELHYTGAAPEEMAQWLAERDLQVACVPQASGDLGARLQHAFANAFARGFARVIAIGTDAPDLGPTAVRAACGALMQTPLVLGPALDGGYYLVGLAQPAPQLFENVAWGTEQVLAQTRAAATAAGIAWRELPPLADLDRPEDLDRWPHLAI